MKRALARGIVPFVSVVSTSCLSVLFASASASADEPPALTAPSSPSSDGLAPRKPEPLSPAEERRVGEIERGIGIGTTATGIAVGAAATGYMVIGLGTGQGQGSLAALGPIVVGCAGAGVGLLLTALGVPLWVSGQARIGHARERERVSLVPSFAPVAGGGVASLAVSF